MTELRWGLTVYGGMFLVWLFCLELPSKDVLGWAPWPSTTLTIRDSIKWWHPVAGLVALILFMLWGHFDRGWNVWWLIAAGILTVTAILVHIFL